METPVVNVKQEKVYLLDTHTWIWWHIAPEKLPLWVKNFISEPPVHSPSKISPLLLSSISVWEFCKLVQKGRLILSVDSRQWIERAIHMTGLFLIPLSPDISYYSSTLPEGCPPDPADQIIAATARTFNATLITRDEQLLRYPHVKTAWKQDG